MTKLASTYTEVKTTSRDILSMNYRLLESMGEWMSDAMNKNLSGGVRIEAVRKVQRISEVFIENMNMNLPVVEVLTLTNIFVSINRDCNKLARYIAKPRLNKDPDMTEALSSIQFLISVFRK